MAPVCDDPRKKQLFDAAKPLFERYGFRKTTVEDVCSAAGVSKRTFYEHFKDKTEFFSRLLHCLGEGMMARWRERRPAGGSARGQMEDFLAFYDDSIAGEPIFRVIFETPELMSACGGSFEGKKTDDAVGIMAEMIQQGIDSGEFRPMDPEYVAWIIGILLDDVYIVLPEFFKLPGAQKDRLLAREVRDFILNGLRAVEG